MGHVVGHNDHTITLPYTFKTIKIGNESTAVVNPTGTTSNVVADSTKDSLTINPSNKWIRIFSDAASDTLTIGHEVHTVTPSTNESSLSSTTAAKTFMIPVYDYDEGGHIVG